jgi:hypothetical protein
VAGLQPGKVHHVAEHRMQRGHAALEQRDELVARVGRHAFELQHVRDVRHHAQVSAQVVRCLPPQLRALALECA